MKVTRIIHIIILLLLLCSCNREESTLSDYRSLVNELKTNSSNYDEEDWKNAIAKFEKIEKKAEKCDFSPKERKEINKLRGQCAAYMLKAITKQATTQIKDAMEGISDMAEGFNEVLGEDDIEELLDIEKE